MSAIRILAIGIVVGMVSSSAANADSMSSPTNWVFFGGGGELPLSYRGSRGIFAATPATPPIFGNPSAATSASPSTSAVPTVASYSSAPATNSSIPSSDTTANSATPAGTRDDAYLNFGTSPAPDASTLTTGTSEPWYLSPAVEKVYGGNVPTASQQASFTNMVLNDVKQTFASSGLNPTITTDPNIQSNHTLSVVSNASHTQNPNAIGISNVGGSGFSFIDKFNFASTPEQLATALSKNISHELMHAFGVGTHPDPTGNYIDAATVSTSLLSNPSATFSPDAVALIKQTGYGESTPGSTGAQGIDGLQEVAPVPEPTTWAIWIVGGVAGLIAHRRRSLKVA